MPLNDYVCKDCGETFEVLTFSLDEVRNKIKCKKCGGVAKKKVGSFSFRLNGRWFNTSGGY